MFKISCHWTSSEHWRLHFVSLTNGTCELEGLSENHCSLKATCAVRDTNTFECITLESRLYVNRKPPHASYLIQNTKPLHSHSPTHTTNGGDTVNHFTFNLTFSRLSVFCNTEETINFYRGAVFFQQAEEDKQWFLDTTSLSPVRTVQLSSRQMDTQSIKSSKHPPDSTRSCFHPSWHQVGLCWFFNICKSLQTAALARFSQQGQVELMRMTAQLLNQIWGFNISWKRDRTWASINEFNMSSNHTVCGK